LAFAVLIGIESPINLQQL